MPNPALRSKGKRKVVGQDDEKSIKIKKVLSNDEKNNTCTGAHIDEKMKASINFQTQILEKLDEELKCNICTEILIRPAVLNCSHIFCEHCITKWKRRQGRCPICREKIESQIRVLALDIFIDKTLEILAPEQKKARNEIISQREKHKRQNPRRSQRLKNRQTLFVTDLENIEDDFHLRALIDILTHLQNPITIED